LHYRIEDIHFMQFSSKIAACRNCTNADHAWSVYRRGHGNKRTVRAEKQSSIQTSFGNIVACSVNSRDATAESEILNKDTDARMNIDSIITPRPSRKPLKLKK